MSVFPLLPGVVGNAEFSADGAHRLWLERRTADAMASYAYALFIGMNPSKAGAEFDDPTIRREWNLTRERFGLKRYIKLNVMTLIATNPDELLGSPELADEDNFLRLRFYAARAHVVVACWGSLPGPLRRYAEEALRAITLAGPVIPALCLGKTADGSPRHGRGVRKDAPLCTFP